MFPALTRLLPRAPCRCFSSHAVVLNAAFPSFNHPRPPLRQQQQGQGFESLDIDPDIPRERDPNKSWNNTLGATVTEQHGKTLSAAERWRAQSTAIVPTLQRVRIPDAYTGRSVQVKPGRFSEAVREFEKILRTNAVRHTWVSTQRHEKKGPKRRRIRSEQWRKHFSHQVRKNVQLVHKIRRRGV